MEPVDPVRFRRFLRRKCARRDLADRAIDLIGPLIDIAGSGDYPLSPVGTVDPADMAAIIADATRCACAGVIPVSSARPVREGWTEEDDFLTHFADAVYVNRKDPLLEAIGDGTKTDIVIEMHAAFLDQLLVAFMQSHGHIAHLVERRLFQAFWSTPALAVFYLCAYAIAGDDRGFEDMSRLVGMLPHAIPLGETWTDVEQWLVLVA